MHRLLQSFIRNVYHPCDGEYVLWSEFRADFLTHLSPGEREHWPDKRIIKELAEVHDVFGRQRHPVGRGPRNVRIIGNLSKVWREPRRWVMVRPGVVRLEDVSASRPVVRPRYTKHD